MNSNECLNAILDMLNYEQVDECDKKGLLRTIKQDLEILELIKKHLYVANGLVEMKITSEEYAKMHNVKFHNGIPIANEEAIDKINKWFWRNFNNE